MLMSSLILYVLGTLPKRWTSTFSLASAVHVLGIITRLFGKEKVRHMVNTEFLITDLQCTIALAREQSGQ
jgi:hypothetical protein